MKFRKSQYANLLLMLVIAKTLYTKNMKFFFQNFTLFV